MQAAKVTVFVRGGVLITAGGKLETASLLPFTTKFRREESDIEVTLLRFEPSRTTFSVAVTRDVAFLREANASESDEVVFLRAVHKSQSVTVGERQGWAPYAEVWGCAWDIGARLALFGAAPNILDQLRRQRLADTISAVTVTCSGTEVAIPISRHQPTPAPHIPTQPVPLDESALLSALSRDFGPGENFVVRADAAMNDPFGSRWFLGDLCTSLEVAAYARFRSTFPNVNPPNFSPRVYLGTDNCLGISPTLLEQDTGSYASCCELWGARHEMLHNGAELVRIYDATKEDAAR